MFRVFNFLQEEYKFMKANNYDNCDLSPLANVTKRTALATGISLRTVSKILSKEREKLSSSAKSTTEAKRGKTSKSKITVNEEEAHTEKKHERMLTLFPRKFTDVDSELSSSCDTTTEETDDTEQQGNEEKEVNIDRNFFEIEIVPSSSCAFEEAVIDIKQEVTEESDSSSEEIMPPVKKLCKSNNYNTDNDE